ncbi:extradiol ring-cleavage dioxygenase [Gordonia pseudamarae]|jgi:2,3-dihydroxybiphenyl 1,2-dioxygenase|uniref:Extradiol ring-cleavage dioxygenase n=1 Tax=Gordonia pseudamarae TaxID=2831662 RepID=A0ABX6IJP4_9ACTN|nr:MULTISPECIES: VOC family protein [Gordonia]MBD0023109.1 VOC family protein [Gordonia sp. (in: high G+C Gram-positive bacteria)]QHN27240.1 extradiol ring-cleavage dioxygenase [Gordonia pseudamarae]QHN36123.1 extradiol ring-cleavage dioxygenase [Gordonia pseudamarae]
MITAYSPTGTTTAGLPAAPAPPDSSIFGRVHLGYIVIETRKFSDWERFGRDAIGLHVDTPTGDVLRFRLDDHKTRFLLRRGPAEDVMAIGWQIDDHESFDGVLARVIAHGVPLVELRPEEAQLRGVERAVRFPGPNGLVQELFTRAHTTTEPLVAVASGGFVTGESGLGHVAVVTKNPHQMRGYYSTVFDARLSDYIDETISGARMKIRFMRVNERHHSIAIANMRDAPLNPVRTRVQHLNIQVTELDDMMQAYQRTKELGFGITMSMGQHTNDKELSFYARTPSGFEWETGWNPIVIDENAWEPTTHQGISIWGHRPEVDKFVNAFTRVREAVGNLGHHEDPVAALSGPGIADD